MIGLGLRGGGGGFRVVSERVVGVEFFVFWFEGFLVTTTVFLFSFFVVSVGYRIFLTWYFVWMVVLECIL